MNTAIEHFLGLKNFLPASPADHKFFKLHILQWHTVFFSNNFVQVEINDFVQAPIN
jgi:hypothetical protein